MGRHVNGGASLVFHLLPLILVLDYFHDHGSLRLVSSECTGNPVIFNFGDSNSDTGGYSFGLGLIFGTPEGRSHSFHQPSGRLCDGRLILDFLCEDINSSYLTPYLESLGPNFRNGANFAISGAATFPKYKPFSLDIQLSQFLRFRARSPLLLSKGYKDLVGEEDFANALHIIDIGQNDLSASFTYLKYSQIIQKIPLFITEIKLAIQSVYEHGGRNLWVHNTGPLGCMPEKLATISHTTSDVDEHGCLQSLNDAARVFNQQLCDVCEQLRSDLKNVTIVFVDMYAIKYDIIANARQYGFENPLMACCGYGGPPYNFNANITCGSSGYNVCERGSRFISWDGVHYTEAANAIFASKILSTNYSTPPIKFDFFCNTS